MHDLIVIGGGPAGTSAAITAARAGAKVLLIEKARFPRHKVCGEFVSAESLDLLGTLLASNFAPLLDESIRIPEGRIFLDGRVLQTAVNPPAASIARFHLDQALWQSAQQFGVETLAQTTVRRLNGQKQDGLGPFLIETSAETYEARAVINSSGRWSNLTMGSNTNFGAAPNSNGHGSEKWLGVKAHFTENSPPLSVDLYFFPGGYCGVQPVSSGHSEGRVNACAMVRADVATNLTDVFLQHPELLERSRYWQLASDPVTTSPLIYRQPEPLRENILQAGDAAAFVDPFVGDGISLALRSGALAAQCLLPFLAQTATLAKAASNYAQTYEQKLARVFRASSQLRRVLSLPRPVRKSFIFLLEKSPRLRNYLVSKTR